MVNKKGQMEFAFFALALFISIGAVIILLNIYLPDVKLVGQTTIRTISAYDLAENAKVFTDIVFEQQLKIQEQVLIDKKGFDTVIYESETIQGVDCDMLILPLITQDCFPNYTKTYTSLLEKEIYSQIQRYGPVNLARNNVAINISPEYNITAYFDNEITVPLYADTTSYYGVLHRPGPTSNQLYELTQENYYKRTGLNSRLRQSLPDTIVMHYTVTKDVDTTYDVLKQAGLSYHYVIDKDGAIYNFIDEDRVAYHAGCGTTPRAGCIQGYNERSIGISLVGCGYNDSSCQIDTCYLDSIIDGQCWAPFTDEQITSTINLISDIASRNPSITIDSNSIIAHSDIDGGKVDSGPAFPLDEVIISTRERIPIS